LDKERLDVLLVQKGCFPSREKARSAIMAGIVYMDGVKADKPGMSYREDSHIEVRENPNPYVSRGGLKLEKALRAFNIVLQGKSAMDMGASTGGFTDCMLKNGAVKVFAVDVGYGQLAWELRNDLRVVCMERTNVRYLKLDDLGMMVDFVTIDVSFISLTKVLTVARDITTPEGEVVCLIKPQFEAGREKVGKHGVVRDPETHREVIARITSFVLANGFRIRGLDFSPIKGPEGNIEYLLYLAKQGDTLEALEENIHKIVETAHQGLKQDS
jgi:23S rRNA (cytidine1920-2'-O)/16S rRNA (cytidine1409-2'-O)-methyltransferase